MKGRIVFLDYMRVFAFVSVLAGHKFSEELTYILSFHADNVITHSLCSFIYNICYGGAAGVIVFFITSGYIITHVLRIESSLEFLIKRAFRIYPLYIAAVLMETVSNYAFSGYLETSIYVWIPRLLLIGDFFNTPLALSNVEWTLRIEIMFYVFMALLKCVGILEKTAWLPLVMLTSTLALYALPQIPGPEYWLHGYITLYTPFLFLGVCIYLLQAKIAPPILCIAAIIIITTFFVKKLAIFHPAWASINFAIPAVLIFMSALALNNKLPDGKLLRLLSSMTYSIYLFHNWGWNFIEIWTAKHGLELIPEKIQTLTILLVGCYITHRLIEINSIKHGKRISALVCRKFPSQIRSPEVLEPKPTR